MLKLYPKIIGKTMANTIYRLKTITKAGFFAIIAAASFFAITCDAIDWSAAFIHGKTFTVSIGEFEHGSLSASPTEAAAGTPITLALSPDEGYMLKPGSLKYGVVSDFYMPINEATNQFLLPPQNVWIAAEFEPIPPDAHTVSVAPEIEHGDVFASPSIARAGELITVYVYPAAAYRLQENSLTYGGTDEASETNAIIDGQFTMPDYDVIINVGFELVPANTYMVSISPELAPNSIAAYPESGEPNTPITLIVIPPTGFHLKAGTLKYGVVLPDFNDIFYMPINEATAPQYHFILTSFDVTIIAEFEPVFVVTFNSQLSNGPGVPASPSMVEIDTTTCTATLPTPPTRPGYAFGGWYGSTGGMGAPFTASTQVTANRTVYAKWLAP
jgi:uncharacterized repeat protein (TIGR02543 family)